MLKPTSASAVPPAPSAASASAAGGRQTRAAIGRSGTHTAGQGRKQPPTLPRAHVGAARKCLTPSPFGASLLWHAFQQVAAARPDAVAVVDAERDWRWTTSQLLKESAALAEVLSGSAAVPGDRIAFCLPNSADWLRLFLAIQRLGMTAVPLDPSLPRDNTARLEAAQVAGAQWLWQPDLAQAAPVDTPPLSPSPGLSQPSPTPVQVLECESYLAFQMTRTTNAARKRLVARQARPVLVKLTSGSTGVPRQIPCTAGHMLADGRNIISTMGIRADDVNMAVIPLGHSYGLGNLVMPLLIQGTPVVVSREFVPRQLGFWIQRYRVTVLPAVPAIFRALAGLTEPRLSPPVRLAISAGGPLSAAIRDVFLAVHGVGIHNFYGSSESGGICYDRTGRAALADGVAGMPLDGVRVSVTPAGRIAVESHAVALGRHAPIRLSKSADDTAPLNFRPGKDSADGVPSPSPLPLQLGHLSAGSSGDIGFGHGRPRRYVLPDLGAWTASGEMRILGRAGAVANVGGKKVHPAEVERALRSIAGVSDCWVGLLRQVDRTAPCSGNIGAGTGSSPAAGLRAASSTSTTSSGTSGDTRLAAAVETALTRTELEHALTAKLADWKLPKAWLLKTQLPRNIRGKLDIPAISRQMSPV